MTNILIFGASRGLGAAFNSGLPESGDKVWLVSRTRPEQLERAEQIERVWVKADLTSPREANAQLAKVIADQRIDVLIYNAGIWEERAFEDDYDFAEVPAEEIENIIAVNLTSAIVCIQKLLPNLKKSNNARVILIGSTSGIDNAGSEAAVVYTASKFGLRGLGHALREELRPQGISVTCINPGEVAAAIPYEEGAERAIEEYQGTRIPVQDLVLIVKCLMGLSRVACIKEIDVPAITDMNA
jgi:short-subunit dehydrogenase